MNEGSQKLRLEAGKGRKGEGRWCVVIDHMRLFVGLKRGNTLVWRGARHSRPSSSSELPPPIPKARALLLGAFFPRSAEMSWDRS